MSMRGNERGRGGYRGAPRGAPGGGYGRGGGGSGDSARGRGGGPGYQGDGGRGRGFERGRGGPPRGGGRGRGGIFDAGPATVDSRLTTHADDELVASFKSLTVQENDLPRRPDFGTAGQEIKLRTNFFPVEYGQATIYDYEILVEPETGIKRIMKRLMQLFMTSPEFAPYAASASHDNMRRLVSLKEIPVTGVAQVFSIRVTYYEDDEDGPTEKSKDYRISLKASTKHDTSEMTKYLGGTDGYNDFDPQPMLSAFNILLAKYPSQHGVMVGRNKWFFPTPGQATDLGGGLEAYRGFYSSVRPSFQQLMVNVNVATTAFYRAGNLAELFLKFGPAGGSRLTTFVYNLRIEMTHTGRKMRKAIKGVKLKDTARNYLFLCDEFGGQKMSVEDYFKRKYKIALKYPTMPLIDIKGDKERPILVPAEVCTILPNQPFRGKLTDEHTANMILVACQPPNVNAQAITGEGLNSLGLVGQDSPLAQMGLRVGPQMATVPGRVLPAPTVHYQGKKSASINNAAWNLRDVKFAVGAKLDNWAVLFIQDGGRDDMAAATSRDVVAGFAATCGRAGMIVPGRQLPPMVDVPLPPKNKEAYPITRPGAITAIRNALISIKPKPKIVLVVLSNHDSAIYDGLKHLCDVQLDVLTVCVTAEKFKNGQVQYNANVSLKFNVKLGGVNHMIKPDDQVMSWIRQQPTMLIGSDVTHPSPGSVRGTPSIAAVVGSVDSMFGQFPASLRLQESKKEMITDLKEMMIERLTAFKMKNKVLPQRILFFRDGVSEGQFLTVRDDELPKMQEAFKKFPTPDGKPYNPKLTILIAGKRHHTRFFPTKDEDADKGNSKPGTVVDRGVTGVYDFDFYLQAHSGLQGTTRPTHYTVVHDDNGFTADRLQALTYGMAYLFARATKAVSLVPPAYYADLACERGRCYLKQLLNAFEGATSIRSGGSTEEQVVEEAHKLWGRGPTGPCVKETMFYI
ncbi:protein argonaute 5 [Ceratobasidium sp. AG-Ba]|nr:protein argonaute 5 [Ceratobasidium sp. AG-Ba]